MSSPTSEMSGIGVRLCVSCLLHGSCLHADSNLFELQKKWRNEVSAQVLQLVDGAGKWENNKRVENYSLHLMYARLRADHMLSELMRGGSWVWKSWWFLNIWWRQGLVCTTNFSVAYSHRNFRQLLGIRQRAAVCFGLFVNGLSMVVCHNEEYCASHLNTDKYLHIQWEITRCSASVYAIRATLTTPSFLTSY